MDCQSPALIRPPPPRTIRSALSRVDMRISEWIRRGRDDKKIFLSWSRILHCQRMWGREGGDLWHSPQTSHPDLQWVFGTGMAPARRLTKLRTSDGLFWKRDESNPQLWRALEWKASSTDPRRDLSDHSSCCLTFVASFSA